MALLSVRGRSARTCYMTHKFTKIILNTQTPFELVPAIELTEKMLIGQHYAAKRVNYTQTTLRIGSTSSQKTTSQRPLQQHHRRKGY